ncbi:hypothetical protein WD019_06695 [Fictibacillus sp. Mic-4]|uniref:zinc ribbon domain-containing protein n=1 Tax=Fictibacillus sp. Mic-4 TaxID=3132826 RepID=UPI003CEE0939
MYCRTCGGHNEESWNYCIHDGTPLHTFVPKNSPVKLKQDLRYCPSCGTDNNKRNNYCENCGNSLFSVEQTKGAFSVQTPALPKLKSSSIFKLNQKKWTSAAISAVLSIALVFILSFFLNMKLGDGMANFLKEKDIDIEELANEIADAGIDAPKPGPIFGLSDTVMMSHLVDSSITFHAEEQGREHERSIDVQTGSPLFLFIPFLGLLAGGFYFAFKNKEETIHERLRSSLFIGLGYGVILAIISLFAGFSYDVTADQGLLRGSYSINTDYSFWGSLVNGIVFGTLFSYIGSILQMGYFKARREIGSTTAYGEPIYQGMATVVKGFILSTIVTFIVFLYHYDDLKIFIDLSASFTAVVVSQLGLWLWGILNLLIMTVNVEDVTSSFHLFTGFDEKTDQTLSWLSSTDLFFGSDFQLWLYLLVFIPILLFIWAGIKISKQSKSIIQGILIFSVTYGLTMAFLAAITNLGISGVSENHEMKDLTLFIGFKLIGTFCISVLFSGVVAGITAYVKRSFGKTY